MAISTGTKQSRTKRAIREFKKWNEEKYPVYNKKGDEQLVLQEDEIFVPVWDYYKMKFDKCYYVSNMGNILSFKFHDTDQPLVMKKVVGTGGYLQAGNDWRVHKLVWFSFMADAIERKNGQEELPYESPLIYGEAIEKLSDLKKLAKEEVEVHHRNSIRTDNRLTNLELLPDDLHDVLTKMKNMEVEEDKWQKLISSSVDSVNSVEATFIRADEEDTVAYSLTMQDVDSILSDQAKQDLIDISNIMLEERWKKITASIFEIVVSEFGIEYFNKDRYLAFNEEKQSTFFKYEVNKLENGKNIVARQISFPIGIDIDIYWQDGSIYLPNYLAEKDGEEGC